MTYAEKLERALTELHNREVEYERCCYASVDAEHEYKMKYAKEFRMADGTVDDRKQQAVEKCETLYREYLKTEAVKAFTKEKVKNSQMALTARQSLLAAEVKGNFAYTNQT